MRITEGQLRKVIRNVIREQQEQVLEEGPREFAIGAAAIAALAIFGIVGRKAPDNIDQAKIEAAEFIKDPDVANKAHEHGVNIESLMRQGNQGMGVGVDFAGTGM